MGVFVSYSSKDSPFIEKLSQRLVDNNIGIWLDKWEMKPGDSLIDKIQDGLEDSSHLLIVLSKNYIQSEFCKKEQNAGLMKEIKSKKVVVIPILLEDCSIPTFLQEKVYADFRTDFDEGFRQLFRSLSIIANDHMGQFYNNGLTVDFALNWGINNDSFFVWLDFINFKKEAERTFFLQIEVRGNEIATCRFKSQIEKGQSWLMLETILLMLHEDHTLQSLDILIENDKPYYQEIRIKDYSTPLLFYVTIRAVLMGKDDGNNVKIHLNDYTTNIMEDRKNRFSKYKN